MRHFNIARKAFAILANLSLLLNSFLPFVSAIKPAYAQSVEDLSPTPTPVEIVENSPTPTPEIVVVETPTPTPEVTPEITPEVTPEVTPTVAPPTVTPENNQPQEPQNNNDNQNNNSPEITPEVTPNVLPTITPTPNPVVKEVEQVCLSESDQIRNSVELDWNYDASKDIYETREKVQLGVKYIFPQDNKVTVTFSCLPADELLRSTLKIKRVKTSDLKLPTIENVGDYVYDITTDMRDGSFKYDITLPKLTDSTAKVSYIEKSLEEATLVPVPASEIKSIENLEQQSDSVKATNVDHFTIFMVTGIWPTTSDDGLVSGEGTSQIRWPKNKNPQSGLGFVGESNLNLETLTSTGNSFILGSLTHYNHPVSSAIIWADLKITLGLSTPKDFTFRVQIDETSNSWPCNSGWQMSGTACDDKVTFPVSISNQIVTVGGIDYTLIIDGFKTTINGTTLGSFVTEENEDNTAYLVGHFVPVGRIIVDKVTNPSGDATSFSFTTTGAGYNSFSLTDSATPNSQILPANRTYSVNESAVSGWTKISTNCISSIGDSEVANNLELDPGEVITCTFTNAKNIASLKVVKNVVPTNDSGKFNLLINGTKYVSNIGNNGETGFITVSSGMATFSETAGTSTNLSDYTTTYSTGCDNGQTTLSIGETKTCTITNTRKAYCGDGIINGSETCDGSNLGSYSSTNFQCNSCSIELKQPKVNICHSTSSNTNPYNIIQPNKNGTVDGHISDNGPVWYPGITIKWGDIIPPFDYIGGSYEGLNWTTEGQAIYNNGCNLPNGTLRVVKVLDNTGGGNKTISDFKFTQNGGSSYINFESDGVNEYSVVPGSYSITEFPDSKYSTSSNQCSGTIGVGQTKTCTITNTYTPKCGDTIVNSGEQCDDGNTVNTDSCTNTCKTATCGDGSIWSGYETCDNGVGNNTTCATTYGTVGSCSYCDASLCTIKTINNPICGDGVVNSTFGEQCDDGNSVNTDSCTNSCKSAICGDGFVQSGEQCDDGNLTAGDGCDAVCKTEPGIIQIKKIIKSGNANYSDFSFSVNGGSPINFESDGTNEFVANIGTTYSINETPNSDYAVSYNNCKNISVVAGESKTCTITNTRNKGTLQIKKNVDLNGDRDYRDPGESNATNWQWQAVGPESVSGNSGDKETVVATGEYTLTETQKENFHQVNLTCINGTLNGNKVTVEKNKNVVCTFVNTRDTGTVTVIKKLNPTSDSGLFNLKVDGSIKKYFASNNSSTGKVSVVTGNHTISEEGALLTDLSNYSASIVCDDGTSFTGTSAAISVSKDQNLVCTITNTRLSTIIVKKQTTPISLDSFNYKFNSENNTFFNGDIDIYDKLKPGTYTITEDIKNGWYLKDLTCNNSATVSLSNRTATVTTTPGSQTICTFSNAKYGKIIGVKFNDKDADTRLDILDEPLLNGWQIFIDTNKNGVYNDGERSTFTTYKIGKYELGAYYFDNLLPGTYQVCEVPQQGWYSTRGSNCQSVTINSNGGDIDDINFSNRQLSNLTVYKFNDLNGDGFRSEGEETLSDWTIKLSDQEPKTTEDGKVDFTNLMPGNFTLTENLFSQSGWKQTNIYCDREEGIDKDNNHEVSLASGQNKICYIGNQRLEPKTTITKSNNSGGVELSPGGSVEYTINVGFSDNSVNNLKVTDLLSNGFKYRVGSYKVYKNGVEVTSQVEEPQYHSPGVWNLSDLGELTPSDIVKLVYTADISTDQQAGKYADLAWSIANYAYDSNKTVLALAGSEGHVDTNFVGTQVAVGGNYQNSVSAEVKQENHVTGQVLGASTELPGTGAATIWLIISGFLGLIGFSFLKFNKKTMLTILLTLLSFGLVISPVRAETSSLSVRLEEPKTPSRIKEIELKYVALDIQGRGVITYCLKKGPTDSSFVQFSSETLSGANGNASHCSLASAITDNGSYQFQVKAVAGGEEVFSNTVSLDYNTSTPGTPNDYRKEQINNCDFKIHFKTADDSGKTVKVELYRSTDSNFSANNESLVVSTDIGSNQEKDIWNNVPDCSKTYYFALRAFDSAGNGSGLVGDKVYTTVTDGTTTVTSTTTNSGAIPVSGTVVPKEGEGDQVNPDTTSEEGAGQVLGTKDLPKENFFVKHPLIYLLIFVVALDIIVYVVQEIKQGKKGSNKKRK